MILDPIRGKNRRMCICLTWFPIGGYGRTPYIPEFGGFTWRVSDCDELIFISQMLMTEIIEAEN